MTLDEVLLYVILCGIAAAVCGMGIGYLLRKRIAEARIGSAEEKAKQIAEDAKKMLDTASREAETLKKETLVQTREEIRRIQQQAGITAIYVTHDQSEAMA
uniref:Rnase Y domain-containing protein n=1 Tax=Dialister sp. TaxID=1955814 RepID=UPI004024C099